MQGLVFDRGEITFRSDLPSPKPDTHEVVVESLLAGVCETDLQLAQGYLNFSGVPGHEFVGIPTSGRLSGQRVVGNINCCPSTPCENCPTQRHHCPNRTVLGILARPGAFAEQFAIPVDNLFVIPDELENDKAVFVEPLAAAFQILEQVSITTQTRVVVVGDGRLGFLIAQACRLKSHHVTVVGKHPQKWNRFKAIGLAVVPLADSSEAGGADVVIDCTGSVSGFSTAVELVRPQGTIVLKTTIASIYELDLAPIVIHEIRVIGSRCGPFQPAIDALTKGEIEVESLITARYPLSEGNEAIKAASSPQHSKVLIDIKSFN